MIRTARRYLKSYGPRATIRAAAVRVQRRFFGQPSYTLLLMRDVGDTGEDAVPFAREALENVTSGILTDADIPAFDRVKFFSFINTTEWLASGSVAVVAKKGTRIIGYVWVHKGPVRVIPGLGKWTLEQNEFWCGPTFVDPAWRGRGIHAWLLSEAVRLSSHPCRFYTAINIENAASLKGFVRSGFQVIGSVTSRRPYWSAPRQYVTALSVEIDFPNRLILHERH